MKARLNKVIRISLQLLMALPATLLLTSLSAATSAPQKATVFTLLPARGDTGLFAYSNQVFELALKKTVVKYGAYQLNFTGSLQNSKRSLHSVKTNQFKNFFVDTSITKARLNDMGHVTFPVHLGIIGYRIFFVSPKSAASIAASTSADDLRAFTIGQGRGWGDVEILRALDFKVVEHNHYESLFPSVANNRIDIFSRGITELYSEYDARIGEYPNLQYNTNLCLHYPLPRFFFTNKSNTAAIERIQEGLQLAYADGSLQTLWRQFYLHHIERAQLKSRMIITLDNPLLKGVAPEYEQYTYNPLKTQ